MFLCFIILLSDSFARVIARARAIARASCQGLLKHALEHIYHKQIFSAFPLTSPRDGYALPNLIEAQLLRLLASRPVEV